MDKQERISRVFKIFDSPEKILDNIDRVSLALDEIGVNMAELCHDTSFIEASPEFPSDFICELCGGKEWFFLKHIYAQDAIPTQEDTQLFYQMAVGGALHDPLERVASKSKLISKIGKKEVKAMIIYLARQEPIDEFELQNELSKISLEILLENLYGQSLGEVEADILKDLKEFLFDSYVCEVMDLTDQAGDIFPTKKVLANPKLIKHKQILEDLGYDFNCLCEGIDALEFLSKFILYDDKCPLKDPIPMDMCYICSGCNEGKRFKELEDRNRSLK